MQALTRDRLENILIDMYERQGSGKITPRFLNLLEIMLKYDTESVSEEHLKWLLETKPSVIDAYVNNPAKVLTPYLEKVLKNYEHRANLGLLVVPGNYVKGDDYNFIDDEYKSELYFQKKPISETNYPEPSYPITANRMFDVALFQQVNDVETDSFERCLFMTAISEVFLGHYALQLLYEQKRDQLIPGAVYTSFEKPRNSFKDISDERIVTSLELDEDRQPIVYFDKFSERKWGAEDYILCFFEIPPPIDEK